MSFVWSYLRPVAWTFSLVVCVSLRAAPQLPGPPQEQPIAILNATIHPVSGPLIEAGTLLFDAGRIVAVGTDVELPDGTLRIEGQGKHVYPGLFSAGGELGLVEINSIRATQDASESGAVNPNVKAEVAVNPDSELIPVTRANGVLLTLTVPSGGLVAGMAAVLQLDGWTWEQMTVAAPVAMHVQWPSMRAGSGGRSERSGGRPQADRTPQLQKLHELFDQAEQFRQAGQGAASDLRLEAMLPVLEGKLPLLVSADSQRQIQTAVAFAAQRKLKLIINGGYDAETCALLLREHDVPVIIPAIYRLPRRRSDPVDAAYTLPERLRQAGVRFCIAGVDRFGASNLRNLPYHAATAAAYGLPAPDALRAITLSPAEILGVADRVGSLDAGKDATLFVADGDPLETETHVLMAFIQGARVDLGNRHDQLWQKYQEKYRRLEARGTRQAAEK